MAGRGRNRQRDGRKSQLGSRTTLVGFQGPPLSSYLKKEGQLLRTLARLEEEMPGKERKAPIQERSSARWSAKGRGGNSSVWETGPGGGSARRGDRSTRSGIEGIFRKRRIHQPSEETSAVYHPRVWKEGASVARAERQLKETSEKNPGGGKSPDGRRRALEGGRRRKGNAPHVSIKDGICVSKGASIRQEGGRNRRCHRKTNTDEREIEKGKKTSPIRRRERLTRRVGGEERCTRNALRRSRGDEKKVRREHRNPGRLLSGRESADQKKVSRSSAAWRNREKGIFSS